MIIYNSSAFYQFVDGAYTLGITANRSRDNNFETVIIGGLDIEPIQQINYQLLENISGNFYGLYDHRLGGGTLPMTLITNNELPGIITITHFDDINGIISGTFEFTVLDDDNNEIKITDGRFDLKYTN